MAHMHEVEWLGLLYVCMWLNTARSLQDVCTSWFFHKSARWAYFPHITSSRVCNFCSREELYTWFIAFISTLKVLIISSWNSPFLSEVRRDDGACQWAEETYPHSGVLQQQLTTGGLGLCPWCTHGSLLKAVHSALGAPRVSWAYVDSGSDGSSRSGNDCGRCCGETKDLHGSTALSLSTHKKSLSFLSVWIIFQFLEFYMNEILCYVIFFAWLFFQRAYFFLRFNEIVIHFSYHYTFLLLSSIPLYG